MRRRKKNREGDFDSLQTELVENTFGDKGPQAKAPAQKDWYTATFNGTSATRTILPGYHIETRSDNAKPNAVDDLTLNIRSKPDEYD